MARARRKSMGRRPTRWIDGNSTGAAENVGVIAFTPLLPRPGIAVPPFYSWVELVQGDIDLEYSDKSEVTIERVVGDITIVSTQLFSPFDHTATGAVRFWVRMGILVVKEIEDILTWTAPDMWDDEAIESFEWMWLNQTPLIPPELGFLSSALDGQVLRFDANETLHVDLHVRRKMGKKDHLVLVSQYGSSLAAGGDIILGMNHLIRVLAKS